MASRHTLRIRDASGESSSFGLPGVDLTGANFDAQVALWVAFRTAVDGISIGNNAEFGLKALGAEIDDTNPANQFAQRELKWLVNWVNSTTGESHQTEIACPDAALLVPGSDLMNIAAGAGAAFVTAFENVVRGGPTGLNLVDITSIRLVGRNI